MFRLLRQYFAREPEPGYPCVEYSGGARSSGENVETIECASMAAICASVERSLDRIDAGDVAAMAVIRRDPEWRLIISGHARRRYAACLLEEGAGLSHWWCGPGAKDEDPYKTALPMRSDVQALVSAFMADPVGLVARPVWGEFNPP